MACCIVATLILAMLQRLMPRRHHGSIDGGFAPTAFRSAPGAVATPPSDTPPLRVARRSLPPNPAWLVRCSALGVITYLGTSALLVSGGAAQSHASVQLWWLRTVIVLALAVITVSVTKSASPRPSPIVLLGCVFLGIGLPWFELTEVDQHVLDLYNVASPTLDAALHGFGFFTIGIGVALLITPATRVRQARQAAESSQGNRGTSRTRPASLRSNG